MKKIFFRKAAQTRRTATAGERKAREIRLLDVDRRFGVGPTEERILAAMKLVQGSLGKDGERVSGKTTAKELAQYFVKQMLNDLMKGSGWKS